MTRKDYVAIAEAIAFARSTLPSPQRRGDIGRAVQTVVDAIAKTLADDNPRFDRERFLQACRTVQS